MAAAALAAALVALAAALAAAATTDGGKAALAAAAAADGGISNRWRRFIKCRLSPDRAAWQCGYEPCEWGATFSG